MLRELFMLFVLGAKTDFQNGTGEGGQKNVPEKQHFKLSHEDKSLSSSAV